MRPQRTLFDANTPWLSHGTPCTRQIGGAQSIITQNQKTGVSPLSPPANYQNRVWYTCVVGGGLKYKYKYKYKIYL